MALEVQGPKTGYLWNGKELVRIPFLGQTNSEHLRGVSFRVGVIETSVPIGGRRIHQSLEQRQSEESVQVPWCSPHCRFLLYLSRRTTSLEDLTLWPIGHFWCVPVPTNRFELKIS